MENINWLDVVLGAAVIISILIGISRGLVKEILSLLAWIIALWLAFHFADKFSKEFIEKFLQDETISYVAAFGVIFLVSLFAIGVLNMLIASLLKFISMTGFDRTLGAIFGLFRGMIIGGLIVFIGSIFPSISSMDLWKQSRLVPVFNGVANYGMQFIPQDIKEKMSTLNFPDIFGTDGKAESLSLSSEGSSTQKTEAEIPQDQSVYTQAPSKQALIELQSIPQESAPSPTELPAIIKEPESQLQPESSHFDRTPKAQTNSITDGSRTIQLESSDQ